MVCNGLPSSKLAPNTDAAELAALLPMPLPGFIFFRKVISKPCSLPKYCNMACNATPAVFFSGCKGIPANSVLFWIVMPGASVLRIRISSPGLLRAKPKMSNPAATLATVAGAKMCRLSKG